VPSDRPVSSLVLAELYDSADASFLNLILDYRVNFKPILGLIERWKKDPRPWARKLKFVFLFGGKSPWECRLVFKRLFKQAWVDRDHELMGAFMAALDCSIRRKRRTRYRYVQRTLETTELLRLPAQSPGYGFSTATKHYLRRRAWRYFRRLGRADAVGYRLGIAAALVRYADDDVRAGENLIDNWGLMHACFGKSPVLAFNSRHTNLSATGALSDLQAAPMFERHWAMPEAAADLIGILLAAQCRPVRIWAIQLLRRLHAEALPKIDAPTLLKLLDHTDEEVAAFASELLNNAQAVASFPMTTWMGLLATRNPTVVATICNAFAKHVSFDRVTLAQAVELATRLAVPVASLGLNILGGKTIKTDADLRELAKLSRAQCAAVGARIAQFAMSRLNVPGTYRVDEIVGFLDSRLKAVRAGAFDALAGQSPADTDPAFWARLFESPYDDVRIELVNRLKKRTDLPGASAESTAYLWQCVLLNIHRGGRAKLSALRQISDRIIREPQHAKVLLPVLAIAIRSVRPPEARHGLAAIVTAVERIPTLTDDVRRDLPELQLELSEAR
jgi:hypothetical protein